MANKKTGQERLASYVSRKVNGHVAYVYNQDGSIEVYSPKYRIVWRIDRDQSTSGRPARDANGNEGIWTAEMLAYDHKVQQAAMAWNKKQEPRK